MVVLLFVGGFALWVAAALICEALFGGPGMPPSAQAPLLAVAPDDARDPSGPQTRRCGSSPSPAVGLV